MKRTVIGLVAAALVAVAVAATAQATIYEKYRYADEWSFATDECGFDIQVTGSASGTFVLREGKNKQEGVFPYVSQYKYSETWTNTHTGEWFAIHGNGVFNEVKATPLGDGTFLFQSVDAGQPFVVEDSDGKVVERNRGSVRGSFLFDPEDDDMPGGIYVEYFEPRINGPHPGLFKHPCEYAVELIS